MKCINKLKTIQKNKNDLNSYYKVGKLLIEAQGGEARAKYGNKLIKEYSEKLTRELGKGYDVSNLKRMRQFYLTFSKGGTMSHLLEGLSWSHVYKILSIKDENARNYYISIIKSQNVPEKVTEYALHNLILENMEGFLKELGIGFTYAGCEVKTKIGRDKHSIDFLLFNYKYNCFVVVEIKVTEFKA